jgi:hypothetical protein
MHLLKKWFLLRSLRDGPKGLLGLGVPPPLTIRVKSGTIFFSIGEEKEL